MANVAAKNSIRTSDNGRVVRSVCSKCGHFIAETPLDHAVETNTYHYCPSCKSMVLVSISYHPR
ncbi:MAG: hypothetical protein [Bacteriophage sp.]|nr:MAG: hypothetical protein [Bacteriophage sp.]